MSLIIAAITSYCSILSNSVPYERITRREKRECAERSRNLPAKLNDPSTPTSNVRGIGVIETVALKMEADHIVGLCLLNCSDRSELDDTDLILDSFGLDITIVESRGYDFLHLRVLKFVVINYNVEEIEI
jgi:hypothetical protein